MLLFIYGYYRWTIEWRLNGILTNAQVTAIDSHPDGRYNVTYEYRVDGTRYARQHSVSQSYFETAAAGQSIEVIYSPTDVSVSGIPGEGRGDYEIPRLPGTFFDVAFVAFALPLMLAFNGLLIFILLLVIRRRMSQLLAL